jgi:hypothetical protein
MANWYANGQYMETCNCTLLCPCITSNMMAMPTEGDCKAAVAMRIDKGEKDGVRLDGLSFIVILHSPGAMADGNITVGLIDERAPTSAEVISHRTGAAGARWPRWDRGRKVAGAENVRSASKEAVWSFPSRQGVIDQAGEVLGSARAVTIYPTTPLPGQQQPRWRATRSVHAWHPLGRFSGTRTTTSRPSRGRVSARSASLRHRSGAAPRPPGRRAQPGRRRRARSLYLF